MVGRGLFLLWLWCCTTGTCHERPTCEGFSKEDCKDTATFLQLKTGNGSSPRREPSICSLAGCITALPGLPPEAEKFLGTMATGYIPVSEDGGRQIFYWFVQSQGTPETDPLLLWTNGGPGCSGLIGFLTEMGPFRPTTDEGALLELNPYAWTEFANMVFVEIPAGVGFSTTTDPTLQYNDSLVAEDNWRFILGFLDRYPHLQSLDFWLTSESYGGHYLPTLATEIVEKNKGEVNFKGFVVGNPLLYQAYTSYGMYATWQAWGMYPANLWELFVSNNCHYSFTPDDPNRTLVPMDKETQNLCTRVRHEIESSMGYSENLMNPYYLGAPKCRRGKNDAPMRSFSFAAGDKIASRLPALENYKYPPCIRTFAKAYLNREDVQRAIHVKCSGWQCSDGKVVTWDECGQDVARRPKTYSMESNNANMIPVIRNLVENASLRMMIMSGNQDPICSTLSAQMWLWNKSIIPYNNSDPWTHFAIDGQLAGFSTNFTAANGHGFRFTVVNGAGHMIPTAQPKRAYEILRKFIFADGW